ncbi:DUF1028 domain-containing protein [Salinarimonas chemoclinalis]|uniref:DUF1028 domain-containing protein n=1 Tax=Salinarimonas chemoclinalis TaxID=3241599 RepID=UPI00355694ED
MTYAILARDPQTGDLGGAVATGTPVVGGFVLHAEPALGIVATQGLSTSTLWGASALRRLVLGETPREVVEGLVAMDEGREARQLAVLDVHGATAAFTGADNLLARGTHEEPGLVVAANWVAGAELPGRVAAGFHAARGDFAERLIAALAAGAAAGGDVRGDRSAALRIVSAERPPVDLRADDDADPIERLRTILAATREPAFQRFLASVPTLLEPEKRAPEASRAR